MTIKKIIINSFLFTGLLFVSITTTTFNPINQAIADGSNTSTAIVTDKKTTRSDCLQNANLWLLWQLDITP